MFNRSFLYALGLVSVLISSCLDMNHRGAGNDIPTKGEVTMHFDRSDSFVIEQLIHQFELEYPQAKINPVYLSHQELLELLNKGEIKGVFLHRSFTNDDKTVLGKKNIKVRSVMVFKSSSAFISNKQLDITPSKQQIIDWLAGENTIAAQSLALYGKGGRFLESIDSLLKLQGKVLKRKIRSCNSPLVVINQVKTDPQVLGVLGLNWLSDDGDSLSLALRKQVNVIAFAPESSIRVKNPPKPATSEASSGIAAFTDVYPFQSQIADKSYPFIEPVWGYDVQGYSGLVSGFLSFVCSHPGQVLIKKSGLYPALPPHRTIELQ
ncbi:MAG: substrate-binding domain-containing protein [Bacteroidota bacterium]|jgi:phosphate transport system substrate-binding protein